MKSGFGIIILYYFQPLVTVVQISANETVAFFVKFTRAVLFFLPGPFIMSSFWLLILYILNVCRKFFF
jgi:hypothetical protein